MFYIEIAHDCIELRLTQTIEHGQAVVMLYRCGHLCGNTNPGKCCACMKRKFVCAACGNPASEWYAGRP